MEKYKKMIDQLKNREVERIVVKKEEFLQFREILVNDEQFKHFRGEAKQGGDIAFTFLDHPRS